MYLFEKIQNSKLYDWPYPHLVIQNALEPDLAQQLVEQEKNKHKSSLWEKVIKENTVNRSSEIVELLDKTLKQPTTEFEINEANFYGSESDNVLPLKIKSPELVRDWHIDGPTKKYQIIWFFGHCEFGGDHEMLEEHSGMKKVIPFTHNMVLAWHNSYKEPRSMHRFYSGYEKRYSFNIPVDYGNN